MEDTQQDPKDRSLVIHGYASVNGVPFGASKAELLTAFGEPIRERFNHQHEMELHYPGFILRLRNGRDEFREATLIPFAKATINGLWVRWDMSFFRAMCEMDGNPREDHGFIVLNRLGLALTGFHDDDKAQLAITCFSSGDWDRFIAKSRPFDLN